MAEPKAKNAQAVKCPGCGEESRRWTQLPDCPKCSAPLGCARFKCQGNGMLVICKRCHCAFNTWEYWKQFAHPYRADPRDPIGLVRYAPNGLPVVNEADGWFRPIRISRMPKERQLQTYQGAYLGVDGKTPLFPDDWEPEPAEWKHKS